MFPKVSVIVPVYNCEKFISKCIDSIIHQTYSNIEVVIVNDGSTDRSEEIVNGFKEKDARIVYYYQDNSGPSDARNHGINKSTGEYLAFIDSDDTVDRYYIELLLDKMKTSEADLVCCGYKDISEYGVLNYTDFDFENSTSLHLFIDMVCKGTGGVLWSKLYKKEIISEYNLKMDKSIFMSEDLIFVLQYALHCKSFAAIKGHLYYYNRLNQNSISSNISIDYIQNYIAVCKHLEKIYFIADMHENKTKEIITKRIQDMVINLVQLQSRNIKVIGMKNAIYNVKKILSIQYIERHMDNFSSNSILCKPYIFLMKNKFVKPSIVYGVCLNTLRELIMKLSKRRINNKT
ncbi:glycosyltransferase family 2 protein [Paenibacillus sp. V4I7]|uniref:glycosyltransferase family 2 protein n=1 Tax=Paenibacillus sp. V4I7 TaxID=3042307 RepID=UPI00277E4D49|nr:glycosyltransferase family 2 protein [Paenibacillus sp. V4I7]MDQ0903968.1 glycosyltransferase involved in cell wall biosynthesis [Paenibacillus sp. V4I7]